MMIYKDFIEYIGPVDSLQGYNKSYKLVLLLSFLRSVSNNGFATVESVVDDFKGFYADRQLKKQLVEKDADSAIMNAANSSFEDVFRVIKEDPYRILNEYGVLFIATLGNIQYFGMEPSLYTKIKQNQQALIKLLHDKLILYYNKIAPSKFDKLFQPLLDLFKGTSDKTANDLKEMLEYVKNEMSNSPLFTESGEPIVSNNTICNDNSQMASQITSAAIESEVIDKYYGKPPKVFELFGKAHSVSSWGEIFQKTCEKLLLYKPYIIAILNENSELNTSKRINFSYDKNDIEHNPKRLSNGLFIECDQKPADAVQIIENLLNLCGYTPDEFKIEIEGD